MNAWLRELGIFNQRSHEKRIPEAAFRLSQRSDRALAAAPVGDGRLHFVGRARTRRRHACTTQRRASGLASDVAALLLRSASWPGTTPRSAGSAPPSIRSIVSGVRDKLRFLEVVGAFGPRAAAALRRCRDALAGVGRTNTNVDTVPTRGVGRRRARAMTAARHLDARRWHARRGHGIRRRSRTSSAVPRAQRRWHYAEKSSRSRRCASRGRATCSGIASWRSIPLARRRSTTSQCRVPRTGSQTELCRKSGRSSRTPTWSIFIYRDEYYNPETTERPGEADLIIAKHRNGGLGDVPLVFQNEYLRFMNRIADDAMSALRARHLRRLRLRRTTRRRARARPCRCRAQLDQPRAGRARSAR